MKKLALYLLLLHLPITAYSQSNYSLMFDTSVAYVAIDSNSVLEADNHAVTVVVWIKPFLQETETPSIWCNHGAYSTFGYTYYGFGVEPNNSVFIKYSDGINTVLYHTDSLIISSDTWQNLIVMIPANRATPSVWLDGVLQNVSKDTPQSAGTADPTVITDGDKFFIGENGYYVNNFKGWIYGLSVWDRVLNNYELFCYSYQLPSGTESGLSAFWDFNEGIGNTTTDLTSNAVVGTLSTNVAWSTDVPVLTGSCGAGIEDNSTTANIAVYPNPTSDIVSFDFSNSSASELSIVDLNGKVLKATTIQNAQIVPVNVSDLTSGIYIVIITVDGQRIAKKIVIQH